MMNKARAILAVVLAIALFAAAAVAEEPDAQALYDAAQALYDAQEYDKAYEAFEALGTFSDSRARAADSRRKWKAARYKEAVDYYKAEQYAEAKEIFASLDDYEESRSYLYKCTLTLLRADYKQAKELYNVGEYQAAQALFASLGTFSDSEERAEAAAERIAEQQQAAHELQSYETGLALQSIGDLEGARAALIEAGPHEGATEALYRVLGAIALRDTYAKAEGDLLNGAYESAYERFFALGEKGYEDSAQRAEAALTTWQADAYARAASLRESDPANACALWLYLGDYQDSAALADELRQSLPDEAPALAAAEELRQAREYRRALILRELGDEQQANDMLKALGDYGDAAKQIQPVAPIFTAKQLRDDKTSPVSSVFTAPDGTAHRYQIYKGVHKWVEAKAFCEALGGHLATLTTPEENAFVYGFMRDCGYLTAYFGLSDEKRTGDWIWVTGEPFEYTNWHKREPSRSAKERYGMFFYLHTDGTWNDSHFYEYAEVDPGCSYICEWDD